MKLKLFFIALGTLLISCSKKDTANNNKTDYYLRCKIDGKEKIYKIPDSAYFPESPHNGIYSLALGGVDDLSTMNQLGIYINEFGSVPITKGKVYKTVAQGGFIQLQAVIYITNLSADGYFSAMSNSSPPYEPAEIVLTEITNTYVKGTFKGKLLVDESTSAAVKYTITEGEFYLPRSQKAFETVSSSGDGYFEGVLDGKKLQVRESDDGLNLTFAHFWTNTDPDPDLYTCLASASSNNLLKTYTSFSLSFADKTPLKAGTYKMGPGDALKFFLSVQYKDSQGKLVTYVGLLSTVNPAGSAEITITKFTKESGQYIEGTFSMLNALSKNGTGNPVSLTNGKFRVKVE